MRNRVSLLSISVILGLVVVMAGIKGYARPPERGGHSWTGSLAGGHTSVPTPRLENILRRDGIQDTSKIITHPFLVRVEIANTGGGSASHSEVIIKFQSAPMAALGKAWADDNQPNRAQIGNLESCTSGGSYPPEGHTCPTNFNGQGWVDLSGAVNTSDKVLIINDPNAGNAANTIIWFAFHIAQDDIRYDVIEKQHGHTFGFGQISATKYSHNVAVMTHRPPPTAVTPPTPETPPPTAGSRPPEVFIIGADAQPGGFGIYHWKGFNWEVIPGGATDITVATDGSAWAVNSNLSIVRWNGSAWITAAGAARDIAGGGGQVYIIGADPTQGGYGIYKWNNVNWTKLPGGAVRIAADSDGNPWVVNSKNEILRMVRGSWQLLPGKATDIGAGGNEVWIIGADAAPGGYHIYRFDRRINSWQAIPGGAVRIDVDNTGTPWIINSDDIICRWNGKGWQTLPGKGKDIGAE